MTELKVTREGSSTELWMKDVPDIGRELLSIVPRVVCLPYLEAWRGNWAETESSFVTDGRMIFKKSTCALGLFAQNGMTINLKSNYHCFVSKPLSDNQVAGVWDQVVAESTGAVTLHGTAVIRCDYDAGPVKTAESVLRCGAHVLLVDAYLLSLALQATAADCITANPLIDLPVFVLRRAGEPVGILVGLRDSAAVRNVPEVLPPAIKVSLSRKPGLAVAA